MAIIQSRKQWLIIFLILLVIVVGFIAFTYNRLVSHDELVKMNWGNLQTTYQRRGDLIPNLVSVVKGASDYEKQTLQQLVEARAKAGQVISNVKDPSFDNYSRQEQTQEEVVNSVNRVIAVVENYPDLKGTKNFLYLQSQLEGTERRIKVARDDFNAAVAEYNKTVRSFPSSFVASLFGYPAKEGFKSDSGAEKAPEIKFNKQS